MSSRTRVIRDRGILTGLALGTGGTSAPTASEDLTAPGLTGGTGAGGTVIETDVLTATTGTAVGEPAPTATVQWRYGGVNIGTAIGLTYTAGSLDDHSDPDDLAYDFVVTWTNSEGSTTATSPASGARVLLPVTATASVVTAPNDPPEAGDVATVSDPGTYTGGGTNTYAYQWRDNGVIIPGSTAINHTCVEGEILSCDVTPTNEAGTALAANPSNTLAAVVPSVVTLIATRTGAGGKSLEGSGGTFTDSGASGGYDYDGLDGSDALTVEDHVVAGNTVGEVDGYDVIAGDVAGWTRVGAPGTRVPTVVVDDPINAPGLTPTSSGNTLQGLTHPSAVGTFVLYFTATTSTDILTAPLTNTDPGLYAFNQGGNTILRARQDGVNNNLTDFTLAQPAAGNGAAAIVEFDDATPGGGTSTMKVAMFDTTAGLQVGTTLTDTYATAEADFSALHKIAENLNGTTFNSVPGLAIDIIAGRVLTDGTPADIADGSDPTGGLGVPARLASYQGVRTGVENPLDATDIVRQTVAGTGDVTAVDPADAPALKNRYGFSKLAAGGGATLAAPALTIPAAGQFTIVGFLIPASGGDTRRGWFNYDDGTITGFARIRAAHEVQFVIQGQTVQLLVGDHGADLYDGVERKYWAQIDNVSGNITVGLTEGGTTLATATAPISGGTVPTGLVTTALYAQPVQIGNHPNTNNSYEGHVGVAFVDRIVSQVEIEALDTLEDIYSDASIQLCPRTVTRLGIAITAATFAGPAGTWTTVGTGTTEITEVGSPRSRGVIQEAQSNGVNTGVNYSGPGSIVATLIRNGDLKTAFTGPQEDGIEVPWIIEEGSIQRIVIKRAVGGSSIDDHITTHWPEILTYAARYALDLTGWVVVYSQGEADSGSSVDANAYRAKMDTLKALWDAAGIAGYIINSVPTITAGGFDFQGTVRTAQQDFAATYTNAFYVDNTDLGVQVDGIHLLEASALTVGDRDGALLTTELFGQPTPVWDLAA